MRTAGIVLIRMIWFALRLGYKVLLFQIKRPMAVKFSVLICFANL